MQKPITTLSQNTPTCHGLEADFLVLLGCLVLNGLFLVDMLRAVAEDTALVIGVMEFGAGRADAAAHQKKKFGSHQHAESRGEEIHPKRIPVAASDC